MRDSKFIVFKRDSVLPQLLDIIGDIAKEDDVEKLEQLLVAVEPIIMKFKAEIEDDEPCFVLRAQDRFAPETVKNYAETCRWKGGSDTHVRRAIEIATQMRTWQEQNPLKVKVPD